MSNERRAALAAAFDAAEKEEEGQETEELEESTDGESTDAEVGEESGVHEEAEETTEEEGTDSQQVEQEAATRKEGKPSSKPAASGKGVAKAGAGSEGQPASEIRAPQSWTPAEREHWAKIPKEAQAAIRRVDKEVQQIMSRSADSRKFQDSFVRTVQPFAHLIRAQNSSPLQAVHNLMTTAAGLTTGTQPQKAAIIAEIIQNYGVDIQTLDDVLSKRPVQQHQAPSALPQQFAEALRPIHQFMSQAEQARAQQIQHIAAEAEAVVSQMAEKLPFFEDLRDEMADFMEVAASHGRTMTLEQAHAAAVNANPEIKKILDQRRRSVQAKQAPNKILRAKKAGSSIVGAPNGSAQGTAKPTSRRAALSEAWDDLS